MQRLCTRWPVLEVQIPLVQRGKDEEPYQRFREKQLYLCWKPPLPQTSIRALWSSSNPHILHICLFLYSFERTDSRLCSLCCSKTWVDSTTTLPFPLQPENITTLTPGNNAIIVVRFKENNKTVSQMNNLPSTTSSRQTLPSQTHWSVAKISEDEHHKLTEHAEMQESD